MKGSVLPVESPRVSYPFRRFLDGWVISTLLIGGVILTPLITVLWGIFQAGPKWAHVSETVLGSYLGNTAVLVVAVSLLSILFAILPAWLVSTCDFPGRRVFEWALVLPLAIPTYVAAFVYFPMLTPLQAWIRLNYGVEVFLWAEKILRYGLLSILMAAVLSPYLYISVRASFSRQRRAAIEASRMLGKSTTYTFFKIALPLSRPAIVAGLSLILMEVINDYGAVNFFGVPTLTEGIFRTWFSLGDRSSAIRLAGLAMMFVLFVLLIEYSQRGSARFSDSARECAPLARRRLKPVPALGAVLICLIPLAIGLGYPLYTLTSWTVMTFSKVMKPDFLAQLGRTFTLSLGTAAVLTLVAIVLGYTVKLHPFRWIRSANRFFNLGYATPGAVIAIGIMVIFGGVDRMAGSAFLSGTVFAIGFGYLVRFLAVAYQPIRAGLTQVCGSLDESSRVLGKSPGVTLFRVNLPIIKGTLLAATMLVFVDILKELPLTMILRPANFDTLATTAFGLAKEGRIHECAVPSLIIIAASACGLIVLNRFMREE